MIKNEDEIKNAAKKLLEESFSDGEKTFILSGEATKIFL